MTTANGRTSDLPINELFLNRWSPRAFTEESLSEEQLMTLFEAARWAASSYNSQPWRFLYARRDTPDWVRFLAILNEYNRSWVKTASALVYIVSNSLMLPPGADKPIPSYTHSFDAGAAAACFALQATLSGLQAHGMAGFDADKAFADLDVPQGYRVEAAFAVGRQGDKAILPEKLQAREVPSKRFSLGEIVIEGGFKPA